MLKKITSLLLFITVLLLVIVVEAADIKKNVPGVSQIPVYPDIWVKVMPYSAENLKKGSVFTAKFKVFKNNKVKTTQWRIDLRVNGVLKKSIHAGNVAFIPIRSREGKSYYNAVLNYTIPKYGNYKFTCFADSLNQVSEKSKLNNKKNISIEVKMPPILKHIKPIMLQTDIILYNEEVRIYDVDKQKGYVEGSMFALNCNWKRIGKEPPVDFVVTAYVDGVRVSGVIGPKNKKSGIFSCGWRATPGYHEVRFQVDKKFGDFPEVTLSNNFKTIGIFIE